MLRLLLPFSTKTLQTGLQTCRQYSHSSLLLGRAHKIVGKKSVADAARSTQIIKISKEIVLASAACAGDLNNMKLVSLISKAKRASMTKDVINKAVDRGSGNKETIVDTESMRYDGIVKLPNDDVISFIILAQSDNKKRTTPQVRHVFTKSNGEMQKTGVMDFMFQEVAEISIKPSDPASPDWEDVVMDAALENGADDVEFLSDPTASALVTAPIPSALTISSALRYLDGEKEPLISILFKTSDPSSNIEVEPTDDAAWDSLEAVVALFEECEDVTDVYHNAI